MTKDNLTDADDGKLALWAERAMAAVAHPETVDPDELASWMDSPEFADACRTALLTKRALLDGAVPTDGRREFQTFRRAHRRVRPLTVWLYTAAAAACIAALLYVVRPGWGGMSAGGDRTEAYLYQAVAGADTAVTIALAGDTVSLATLARQQTGPARAISVSGNTVQLQPVDYSGYEIIPSTINVPQGKVVRLDLPDGTRVWLNAFSSLIYPTDFREGEPRRVQLRGEAYFSVARDESRPFIVDCEGLQTRVLGTEFNIRSYAGGEPCVTLVGGRVEVSTGSRQVTLLPNQSATVDAGGQLTVGMEPDVEAVTCWRDNRFYFDGQSLRDIMIEVGRWYNMDVVIGSNSHIGDRLHFRGERRWTIQQLVDQINMISNAEIRISDNTLTVY